jgi:hypothetical protein
VISAIVWGTAVVGVVEAAWIVLMALAVVPFKVSVVFNEKVCLGRVSSRAWLQPKTVFIRIVSPVVANDRVIGVTRGAYGVTWCYGWEGRASQALRALVALTS